MVEFIWICLGPMPQACGGIIQGKEVLSWTLSRAHKQSLNLGPRRWGESSRAELPYSPGAALWFPPWCVLRRAPRSAGVLGAGSCAAPPTEEPGLRPLWSSSHRESLKKDWENPRECVTWEGDVLSSTLTPQVSLPKRPEIFLFFHGNKKWINISYIALQPSKSGAAIASNSFALS